VNDVDVSIVTPSLNQGKFIGAAIESVVAQAIPTLEHIVVDGGSTDETLAILSRYGQLRVLEDPGTGQSQAINLGFRAARGAMIGWLNADDRYASGAVRGALSALEEHPDAGIVYGNAEVIDEAGKVRDVIVSGPFDLEQQLNGINRIPQPAVFMRASLLTEIGLLDERLDYVMDYELWLRAARVTRLVWIDETWAQFRLHSESKTVGQWHAFWPEARGVARAAAGPYFSTAWRNRTLNLAFLKMSLRRLGRRRSS
jgi:glycosyltransferase involved in cell wall biosynthesis